MVKINKIIAIGLILFIFAGIIKAEEEGLDAVLNCNLYDLEGKIVRLSDFKGKPVILWFWTTWCPYCRGAIAELNNVYPELKLSGIELLAIDVDEPNERISRFLKIYKIDFPVLLDKDARCALSFGIIGVPTYALIDRKGKIRFKQNYFPDEEYEDLLLN